MTSFAVQLVAFEAYRDLVKIAGEDTETAGLAQASTVALRPPAAVATRILESAMLLLCRLSMRLTSCQITSLLAGRSALERAVSTTSIGPVLTDVAVTTVTLSTSSCRALKTIQIVRELLASWPEGVDGESRRRSRTICRSGQSPSPPASGTAQPKSAPRTRPRPLQVHPAAAARPRPITSGAVPEAAALRPSLELLVRQLARALGNPDSNI